MGERKSNRRDSEAGLFLDIMARHRDFAVIVALVGNGQEINTGEAGLATWGEALARRPDWQIVAPADVIGHTDPARRLFDTPPSSLTIDPRLHLDVSLRQIRADAASAWIDAVLTGDEDTARRIAETDAGLPFLLSRSLTETRAALRHLARGTRRAGLVCSAGARRLRPEGLSCDFPHLDAKTVANWFLQNWPEDVRASDALELPATQFACQGLELDYVGLCWDSDLIRQPGTAPWQARSFKGTRWQISRRPEEIAWRVNTYRVLLSRARYETVIFVPEGAPDDATRPPATYDAIADFLTRCGARDAATILQPDAEPAAPLQHALPAL